MSKKAQEYKILKKSHPDVICIKGWGFAWKPHQTCWNGPDIDDIVCPIRLNIVESNSFAIKIPFCDLFKVAANEA